MSRIIIYPVLPSPAGSSDPPENVTGSHIVFYSVLLRMGFTCALPVARKAVVSYTAFPPLPDCSGGIFLLHCPWSHLHQTLSGILPCEARTFLSRALSSARQRPSGLLIIQTVSEYHALSRLSRNFYTFRQLPPINSRRMEFFGISSLLTPRK